MTLSGKSSEEFGPDKMDADLANMQFVKWLQQRKLITKPEIFAAFVAIPRYKFLPNMSLEKVYVNASVVTKRAGRRSISSATKPGVVAVMLEQMDLQRGQSVLEIGTGSGYTTALISHIIGPDGYIVSLDIDDDMIHIAEQNLMSFNFANLRLVCADGSFGYASGGPFDRIIFTASINDFPVFWRRQLKDNGVVLAPLWLKNGIQRTIALQKRNDALFSQSIRKCNFMRLRGPMAGYESYTFLDDNSSLITGIEDEKNNIYLTRLSSLLSNEYIEHELEEPYAINGKGLEEFIFYAGLRGANILTLYDYEVNDNFFCENTLGIYETSSQSLFVVQYNRQHCKFGRQYNSDDAMRQYINLFKEWAANGKPGDLAINVIVLPKEKGLGAVYSQRNDTFLFEKNNCSIIYEIEQAR